MQTTIEEEAAQVAAEAAAIPAKPRFKDQYEEERYLLSEILRPGAPITLHAPLQVQRMLGMTENSLAIMRMQGRGPKFLKMGNNMIRYRSDDLVAWLKSCERTSTSDRGPVK